MTDWMMQSTVKDPRVLLGRFLQRHTASPADLAQRIACDKRTADGFRAGRHWPQAKHWFDLVHAFGEDITEAVFHPHKAAARLERQVHDLKIQLAAVERAAADAAGVAAGLDAIAPARSPWAAQEDGAAGVDGR